MKVHPVQRTDSVEIIAIFVSHKWEKLVSLFIVVQTLYWVPIKHYVQLHKNIKKQERFLVGCVPPAVLVCGWADPGESAQPPPP